MCDAAQVGYVRVEVEAAVGDALDDGGAGREEGAQLVAVQDHRQTPRGAAGEQHTISRGHPNGEEVPDDRVPDALPSEINPSVLQVNSYVVRRCQNKMSANYYSD